MTMWTNAALAGIFTASAFLFSGQAEAATQQRDCLVDSVAVIGDRMHIKCVPIAPVGFTKDILYYAMNLREGPAKIESIVMLAIESKRRNKAMKIHFDYEDYNSVPGCNGSNCRVLHGAIME